jgi:vacuolar-type H+-ATPase subunit H
MLQQSFPQTLIAETHFNTSEYSPHHSSPAMLDERLGHRSDESELTLVNIESPDVFVAIDRLEESILNSPRLPLTGKTMVNEEEILEQLDAIRLSLPAVVAIAQEIIQYKEQIIKEAQQQVQQILADANQRAYQVANELGIIDRAEQEARQIRQVAIAECEHLRQQTVTEVERVRNHNIQEMERMRQQVTLECEQVQDGADEYADRILHNMESQLTDILQAIQRGRQRLNTESTSLKLTPASEQALTPKIEQRSICGERDLPAKGKT